MHTNTKQLVRSEISRVVCI